jgi:hypothetical protein
MSGTISLLSLFAFMGWTGIFLPYLFISIVCLFTSFNTVVILQVMTAGERTSKN